jgi:choline dehydrogenase-like flavoprotein
MAEPLIRIAPGAKSIAPRCERAQPGTITCDVVVVGTGAGGAVAGSEFARAGRRVVFLEVGGAFARGDFAKRSMAWSLTRVWASKGTQTSSSMPVMLVPSGRAVGGSTVLNSAICFRPPHQRLHEWQQLTGSSVWDPKYLDPVVDEIWERVGVAPTHAAIGRRNNLLFAQGCEALRYKHAWMDRNAPGCVGCGVCLLGCPSGGKASVDKAILPEAVDNGARILTRARVRDVIIEGGRATGVVAEIIDPDTEQPTGELIVKAEIVIVAGGALFSPLVLERSGIKNAHLGEHLAIHPGIGVFGEFKEPVVMWDGVPQGYYAYAPNDDRALLETANVGPGELFSLLVKAGDFEMMHRLKHLALAGAMIRDSGNGSVRLDDDNGVVRPRFSIHLNDRDLLAFRNGAKAIVRAWFAAGAKAVAPGVQPVRFCNTEAEAFDQIEELTTMERLGQPYGSHPHGTCRMGPKDGPNAGVVDADGQVHGVRRLFVMDGSVFPTTLGVNPQITIMSTAASLARRALATI